MIAWIKQTLHSEQVGIGEVAPLQLAFLEFYCLTRNCVGDAQDEEEDGGWGTIGNDIEIVLG